MNLRIFLLLLTLILTPFICIAQSIQLANASFEGEHADATMPQEWSACQMGSTPDILPGSWGVYLEPFEGNSYIGLITREDGSYESIGQKLNTPIQAQECYSFTVELAHSNTYANYNLPIRLRVWGATSRCSKDQLLVDSPSVKHLDWKTYELEFVSEAEYPYIVIEAFYAKGVYFSYRGNILVDGISIIRTCPRA